MDKTDKLLQIDIVNLQSIHGLPEKTLLETLEAAGIACHYHCRDGFCGACRTKLLSGTVTYTSDPLAFIDDDEILPCCCKPDGPIKIDIPQ